MEPGKRVLSLIFNRKSKVAPGKPYRHFGAYYQVVKGGDLGYSFAMHPPQFIRLKKDILNPNIETYEYVNYYPYKYRSGMLDGFDYLLVRGYKSGNVAALKRVQKKLKFKTRYDNWSLYEIVG
jgi:hypothetical protein